MNYPQPSNYPQITLPRALPSYPTPPYIEGAGVGEGEPGVYEKAKLLPVIRGSATGWKPQDLEPEVKYFILALEQFGVETTDSCGGHPAGWHIAFYSTYEQAVKIKSAGVFLLEVTKRPFWFTLRLEQGTPEDKEWLLGLAARSWELTLGPLKALQ